jgi:hypothetical protein
VACARRNCRQVRADRTGAGSTPARCRMVHTVLAPILSLDPRRHSSPWMRRYPRSVLPGQPQHQLAELCRHGWPATLVRIGPAASDQVAMPAQQGFGLDRQPAPGWSGQQPYEPSQHRPVGPVDPRPGPLAAQHRDLVAQHQQLGVLCRRASGQQRKPAHHLAAEQIEQSQGHASIIVARWLGWRTCSSAPTTEFLAPTGVGAQDDERRCVLRSRTVTTRRDVDATLFHPAPHLRMCALYTFQLPGTHPGHATSARDAIRTSLPNVAGDERQHTSRGRKRFPRQPRRITHAADVACAVL